MAVPLIGGVGGTGAARPASAFWVSGIWFEPDIDAALAGPSKMFATVDNRRAADVVDVVVDLCAVVIEFERGDALELSTTDTLPRLANEARRE